MAVQTVPVCWTPKQTTAPLVFLDGKGSPYANDIIAITEPTQLTFNASKACSDPAFYPFTMRVAPTANDISVIDNGGSSVSVLAKYVTINQLAPLNMTMIGGGTTIESGKPIIRNDPHRSFNALVLVIGGLLLIALAYMIWKRTANMRDRDRTGES